MNIVEPYARIQDWLGLPFKLNQGICLLQRIESIGRVSHRSEDKQTEDSWKRFIPAVVLQHGDWSITEHCSLTVEALVDRGITHEWVRHRIGAYTQESTRFVNYNKKEIEFINPFNPSYIGEFTNGQVDWMNVMETCSITYSQLIDSGVAPQIARSVLPNALASKLIVTYNLRSWRWFFLMRTSRETHPQMRQVTIPLLQEFQTKIPLLYDDIVPESRQADNLRLPK